jgi:hypothetical protein
LHVGGIQDGASARDDAAAEQCSLSEWHLFWYDSELVFVNECLFGKATESETLEHTNSIATQTRRFFGSTQCRFPMLALK